MKRCPLNNHQTENLFFDLVAGYGFLLTPDAKHYVRDNPPDTIDDFTDLVLWECDLSPERHPEDRAAVREIVAKHFADAVSK